MSELRRYEATLVHKCGENPYMVMASADDGDYCEYQQAADEITRLRQLLSEAEKREAEAIAGWRKLDTAYSNFVNGYGDPYEPKEAHDAETARNLKNLADAVAVYRALQLEER